MVKRVPKGYDGLKPTGREAHDLVDPILAKIQRSVEARPQNIFNIFSDLLSEKIRPLVKPVFYQNGVLKVKVQNATLLSILSSQEKGRLVHNLRSRLPSLKIQDIVFQIG